MSDSKISALPDGAPLQAADEFVIARSGSNYKIPATEFMSTIFDSTLGADAASIDTGAGSIPPGYGALLILILARTADAGATGGIAVTLNNDSSAIYDDERLSDSGATETAGFEVAQTSWHTIVHGSGGSSGYPGVWTIHLPAYDQTTFWKVATMNIAIPDATSTNQVQGTFGLGYRSTSAISRLKVAGSTANLKAGSRLLIYGLP